MIAYFNIYPVLHTIMTMAQKKEINGLTVPSFYLRNETIFQATLAMIPYTQHLSAVFLYRYKTLWKHFAINTPFRVSLFLFASK